MTERYSFAVDRHLVDSNIIWSQDNVDNVNSTLTDTINESYVTAEEDSPTRYLSVLDTTNEMSLENLNITLANPKLEEDDSETVNYVTEEILEEPEENNDQVVVFTVEGSDELFGIQSVQDEEGNIQKYQFQFRKNENGQLEAIPETITLISMEEDVQQGLEDNFVGNIEYNEEQTKQMHIFVQEDNSEEHILPDHIEQEEGEGNEEGMFHEEEQLEDEVEEEVEESVDIKPGIIAFQSVKQEIQDNTEYDMSEPVEEELRMAEPEFSPNFQQPQPEEENLIQYHTEIHQQQQNDENSMSSETLQNIEHQDKENEDVDQNIEDTINTQEYEHVVVNPDVNLQTEDHLELHEETEDFNNDSINDSDENDYQIVEGLHITGDVESNDLLDQPIMEKHTAISNTNILKQALKANKEQHKIVKRDNRLYLYVVQHPEKENVDSLTMSMSNLCRPKVNPRSILKSSHAMFQHVNEIDNDVQDDRMNKRFARCKEAMQARIFNDFISKTTIPQAPVRKNRSPRKQKIKPVERMDEEIVVQEVMVSSNGFVEAVSGRDVNKENLAVTEYVELTDSDDDYDPKKITRKKKKHRRRKIEITISDDSDASNDSVIELDESDEEQDKNRKSEENSSNNNTPPKRRRGRPPKNKSSGETMVDSPAKKSRLETNDMPTKPEIPCPKCNKTFPSQNSLKTHLQHHNLQSSLRRALPEYKYKCEKCGTSFINNILLKKHMCSKLFNCTVCKKSFNDLTGLNVHKRTHAKDRMVKSTTTVQVSPKKIKPSVQTNSPFKVPKTNSSKCKKCGKLCSSLQNLTVHMKTHKEFKCNSCSKIFMSQLILEKHLRESCVKSPQRSKSMLGKKSPIGSLHKLLRTKSPTKSRLSVNVLKVKCEKCEMQFNSYQALFKHKVAKHGLETPNKTVLDKEDGGETGCGGVPVAGKLKDAYAELRTQLNFND